MKSMIRYGLLAIALICFSNMGIAQKKNKKKAKTTISAKKKKKSTKKTTTRKKQSVKKRPSVAIYKVVDTISPLRPITSLPFKNYTIDSIPEKVVTIVSAFKPQLKNVAKIGFLNATAVVDTNSVLLSYQVPSQNLSFQYQPIALVPRAIKIDSLNAIKQSANIKIGMGN